MSAIGGRPEVTGRRSERREDPKRTRRQCISEVQFRPRLRENVRARKARRMVFSIVLSRQPSPALLFFKLIEVETKFPFANSISEFSRSQGQNRKYSLRADDVRSTPESGLKSDIRPCPKSAKKRHPVVSRSVECESAWGPIADRPHKRSIDFVSVGSMFGVVSQHCKRNHFPAI